MVDKMDLSLEKQCPSSKTKLHMCHKTSNKTSSASYINTPSSFESLMPRPLAMESRFQNNRRCKIIWFVAHFGKTSLIPLRGFAKLNKSKIYLDRAH